MIGQVSERIQVLMPEQVSPVLSALCGCLGLSSLLGCAVWPVFAGLLGCACALYSLPCLGLALVLSGLSPLLGYDVGALSESVSLLQCVCPVFSACFPACLSSVPCLGLVQVLSGSVPCVAMWLGYDVRALSESVSLLQCVCPVFSACFPACLSSVPCLGLVQVLSGSVPCVAMWLGYDVRALSESVSLLQCVCPVFSACFLLGCAVCLVWALSRSCPGLSPCVAMSWLGYDVPALSESVSLLQCVCPVFSACFLLGCAVSLVWALSRSCPGLSPPCVAMSWLGYDVRALSESVSLLQCVCPVFSACFLLGCAVRLVWALSRSCPGLSPCVAMSWLCRVPCLLCLVPGLRPLLGYDVLALLESVSLPGAPCALSSLPCLALSGSESPASWCPGLGAPCCVTCLLCLVWVFQGQKEQGEYGRSAGTEQSIRPCSCRLRFLFEIDARHAQGLPSLPIIPSASSSQRRKKLRWKRRRMWKTEDSNEMELDNSAANWMLKGQCRIEGPDGGSECLEVKNAYRRQELLVHPEKSARTPFLHGADGGPLYAHWPLPPSWFGSFKTLEVTRSTHQQQSCGHTGSLARGAAQRQSWIECRAGACSRPGFMQRGKPPMTTSVGRHVAGAAYMLHD